MNREPHVVWLVIEFPRGKGYCITARDVTTKEKQRYADCFGCPKRMGSGYRARLYS